MKQECNLGMVWLTWLGIPILAIVIGIMLGWFAAVFMLVVGVFSQIIYVKIFPQISQWLGYGSMADKAAESTQKIKVPSKVILYTANVCPFCPIVRQRLIELQKNLEFPLEEIDVTFKPNLIKEKGLRSVPVVEKDGKYWIGNATSAQLLSFITET